ncbi:MAG: TonB-dependent receptor [Candidatus Marinimicrobia bacterium]|nr:TonB-dependent receptor [Candidatus Neomarinimicrobiota bacterium]
MQPSKVILTILILLSSLLASNGTIAGRVIDEGTQKPLIGVNVILEKTTLGAASDINGDFRIENVEPGNYNLSFHFMGYKKIMKSDIQVKPDRTTIQNAELPEAVLQGETVIVTTGYFTEADEKTISNFSFNAEEVRRSPGSAGDVSRILMALPSTAQVYDNANDLMVRGGSPIENGFFIDNIEIPNINHFPTKGSTGGPIGMLNVDFIEDVNFNAGGFDATYGDKLSSITNIDYRDGNRENMEFQLDMGMSGFGGVGEGPLFNGKGTWLLSARKSYLDMLVEAIGTGAAPAYYDIQGKFTFDINPKNKLTFLNIYGNSAIGYDHDVAEDSDMPSYGDMEVNQNTAGVNWKFLWNHKGYSNTSLAYSYSDNDDRWYDTDDERPLQGSHSKDNAVRIRNINSYKFNPKNRIEFGFNATYTNADFKNFFGTYTDRLGNEKAAQTIAMDHQSISFGPFVNYQYSFSPNFIIAAGLRSDYYDYNENLNISPRLSLSYKINPVITLKAAWGNYYQNLPIFLLSQNEAFKNLKSVKATHYVAGMDWMITSDTKFSLEIYNKDYDNCPLDPSDPYAFIIDDGRHMNYFRSYPELVDNGEANSRGIELLLQKKMAKDFYGMVSATIFQSRYKDYTGKWRNRVYDNQFLFTVVGGYKPNNKWEFSSKWTYAGGVPYTPFDKELSTEMGVGIIDQNHINDARMDDYHSLNLRADRRFYFNQSALVLYFSVWNAYNRQNVAIYYWNEDENKQDTYNQWSMLPMGGFEWEF